MLISYGNIPYQNINFKLITYIQEYNWLILQLYILTSTSIKRPQKSVLHLWLHVTTQNILEKRTQLCKPQTRIDYVQLKKNYIYSTRIIFISSGRESENIRSSIWKHPQRTSSKISRFRPHSVHPCSPFVTW